MSESTKETAVEAFRKRMAFEEGLVPGTIVTIAWTNSYRSYFEKAEIVRVNAKSVRAKLLTSWGGVYPLGREISVPRFFGAGYSGSNGVFPFDAETWAKTEAKREHMDNVHARIRQEQRANDPILVKAAVDLAVAFRGISVQGEA